MCICTRVFLLDSLSYSKDFKAVYSNRYSDTGRFICIIHACYIGVNPRIS